MNLKTLFEHNLNGSNIKVDQYTKRRGFIKKKTEGLRGQLGINAGSENIFFSFMLQGRLLCYFSDTFKKNRELLGVIRVGRIIEVRDLGKTKKGQLVLVTADNEVVQLKCEEQKEASDWVSAIWFFKKLYEKEKNDDGDVLNLDVDMETKIAIFKEIELEKWSTISSKYDYTSFVKDKGLKLIFENNLMEVLKNRVVIATAYQDLVQKKSIIPVDPQTVTTGFRKDRFSLGNLAGSMYYLCMISQKPNYIVDKEFQKNSDVMLEKASIPDWMDFNVLYFYEYQGIGDITTYRRAIDAS